MARYHVILLWFLWQLWLQNCASQRADRVPRQRPRPRPGNEGIDGLDPTRYIYCEGKLPEIWSRPTGPAIQSAIMPTAAYQQFRTPRELCAAIRYGGKESFNQAAWFSQAAGRVIIGETRSDPDSEEDLFFKGYPDYLNIFCSLRCRGIPSHFFVPGSDLLTTRRGVERLVELLEHPEFNGFGYTFFPREVTGHDTRKIRVTRGIEPPDFSRSQQVVYKQLRYGSSPVLYPDNLRCRGELPPQPWPAPFHDLDLGDKDPSSPRRSFQNITSLCAAIFSGGDARGNAGMICVKQQDGKSALASETFLAHPALYRANSEGGIFIDYWCHRACDCPDSAEDLAKSMRDTLKLSDVGVRSLEGTISFGPSTPMMVTGTKDGKNVQYRVPMGSARQCTIADRGKSQSCLEADTQEVDPGFLLALQEERLKPIEKPLAIKNQQPQIPVDNSDAKCGKRCGGPADCSGTQPCSFCVYKPGPNWVQAGNVQSYVLSAIAQCLPLAIERSRLGGRSLQNETSGGRFGHEKDDIMQYVLEKKISCACNATYTSAGCCAAPKDGIIFEDSGLSTGPVELEEL